MVLPEKGAFDFKISLKNLYLKCFGGRTLIKEKVLVFFVRKSLLSGKKAS